MAVDDLGSSGFGYGWGHTRIFSNRLSGDFDFGNGYNWLVKQWPYLVQDGLTIVVMRGTRSTLWFDWNGSAYVARYGAKHLLTHDPASQTFKLVAPNGFVWLYQDFTQTANPQGLFKSLTTNGGQVTQVVSYAGQQIGEIQRSSGPAGSSSSSSSGAAATIESYLYAYSGNDVTTALLRRQTGGGAWTNVRRVNYAYYGSNDPSGLPGDLQTATLQVWNGSSWATKDIHYYRYWTSVSGGVGLPHGIKFVVNPDAYNRLLAATGNPLTATDTQVAQYADFYLEYDGARRVTKEVTDGGLHAYTFSYANSGNANDYNNWSAKTVETRPDGSQHTVYTNYVGQVMLKQLSSGTSSWMTYQQFDGNANLVLSAMPSAVASYNDTQANLGVQLNATSGLIHLYDYFSTGSSSSSSSSSAGAGAAPGYVADEKVKQGSSGTPILLKQYQYSSQSAGGVTIYPLIKEIVYRNDDGTGAIETDYGYTFYSGTNQILQKTTTWPVVPTSQNGSGTADSRTAQSDLAGNVTWIKDERGFLTRMQYDISSAGMTQRIDDVDTTQVSDAPPGWTTPSGGGLNLITDYQVDDLGRMTQTLGPSHTVDIGGTATTVRTANWTVYQDATEQLWTGQGYATGTAPNYTYTLVNPVSITISDADGRVTDQISVIRSSTSGALSASDSFPQSSYCRWTTQGYNDNGQLVYSRQYFSIPSSGTGSSGRNYNETDFGYDAMGRRNKTVTPGGTIERTVFDVRGLSLSVYVGTNDTAATDSDPTGGGATGNNMVAVQINVYDAGSSGGDGTLTQHTLPVDATSANNRVWTFQYDWRDRQTRTTASQDYYTVNTFDTPDRITLVDRHALATNNLIARTQTLYDDRGRVYQTIRYAVDPNTGIVGNSLADNSWYDPAGNVIKQLPSGSNAFVKSVYDSLGRQVTQYVGYDLGSGESNYSSASDVTDDTLFEQSETTFDRANNVIQTTTRQRFHNATGVGPLTYPGGSQPQARVTYMPHYPDAIGRTQAIADYGTNGDVTFSRSATIPISSDTALVNSTLYNSRGEAYRSIDSIGLVDETTFDDAGRRTQLVLNVQGSSSSSSSSSGLPASDDQNNTTRWSYTGDSLVATLTAINSTTGTQVTTYGYGVSLSASDIARNDVLSSATYPDAGVAIYLVNRQSQIKQFTDQRQVVHQFHFDFLGRQTEDLVTSLGTNSSSSSSSSSSSLPSGVDGTVQRIARTYEVRGLPQNVTSYSSPIIGQGMIVKDIERVYNAFEQLVTEYQEHSGAVNTSTSTNVRYQYADGSSNTIRPTGVTYPNGRLLTYSYGTSGGVGDALSRIEGLIDNDGTTHLVDYTRIGADAFVQQSSPQPQIAWSLINGTGADPYTGLDQFNRVVDNRWYSTASSSSSSSPSGSSSSGGTSFSADLDRIQHGYDRASNRLWRKNTVAEAAGVYLDELYSYDGLYRLGGVQRGELNGSNNGMITGTLDFAQAWGLDATGNWKVFLEDGSGSGSWTLNQSRTANQVNEITGISGGAWVVPAYDAAGNMTTMPQPAAPTSGYTAVYDAWNRLISLSASGATVSQYAYDGENRRATAVISGMTRHFYYSTTSQVLEERLGASNTADRQFIWGLRYIDDLVLRDRGTERFYGLQDPNWNVTAIAGISGAIQERYSYTGYGTVVVRTSAFIAGRSSSYDWDTLYAGYRFDSSSSLYFVRNRYYGPSLGTWLTRDPISYKGGMNLYEYISDSPVTLSDPFGLKGKTERMHWFMKYWSKGKGQGLVDNLCRCPSININNYVTEYTVEEHRWIHRRHGSEVGIRYQDMYEAILDRSKNCCDLLKAMLAMMLGWDAVVKMAGEAGLISDVSNNPFDLINYYTTKIPPVSQLPGYLAKLYEACGSSEDLKRITLKDVQEQANKIIKEIRGYEGMDKTMSDIVFDFIYMSLRTAVPAPVPACCPAPKLVPILKKAG